MINALQADNPEYKKKIAFFYLDWDNFSGSEVARKYGANRQSTLVIVEPSGKSQTVVAATGKARIQGMLDAGVAKSTSSKACTI